MKKFILTNNILFFIYLIIFNGCSESTASKYLDTVLDSIEIYSINKKEIDWNSFRKELHEQADEAKEINQLYPIIRYTLLNLKDNHSAFYTPEEFKTFFDDTVFISSNNFSPKVIDNKIGYIKIPAWMCLNDSISIVYIKTLQQAIEKLDSNNLDGWIIDLRDNTGGSLFPMLIGLTPLLGNGTIGYFYQSDNTYNPWILNAGAASIGSKEYFKIKESYQLKHKNKKIATLINQNTASAGEAVAIAFRGMPNTRSFGENSFGATTGTKGILLADSAMIFLAVNKFADRNKKIYETNVSPDEIINNPEEVIKFAINWIEN